MAGYERFVIQRRVGRTLPEVWVDWENPMSGRTEYETHGHAASTLLRRANVTDYRIVRRVFTWSDEPVSLYR